jgi:hypothetical protein
MIVLSWNYRRLENLWAILDLCRLVKEKRPNLVFLMETKLQVHCLESIKVRVGFGSVFVVDCVGQSGGLALMWKGELSVEIQNYSCFHINAIVRTEANSPPWKFTAFYGHPIAHKRKESWSLLRHLESFHPESWLCMGDFNEITHESEKFGARCKPISQMAEFRLEKCHLKDLGFVGPKFTWWNMQDGVHLLRRGWTGLWQIMVG